MKIAVIDTTIGTDLIGGAHTFLVELVKRLTDRGHELHFITRGEPNEKVRPQVENSGAQLYPGLWNQSDLIKDAAPVLAKWLNEFGADVFVISASGDMGWVVLPMLDPGIATLTIGHNDSETFYMPARYYRDFLTGAVGVSEEICERYKRDCGITAGRVDWIPYGVSATECPPSDISDGPLNIIYVGRLDEEQKRTSDLIGVVKSLSREKVGFRLSIVGDGDEMPAVRSELAAEVASGRVILHGWLDGGEVLEKLRTSDVFILTSAYEGFCIALTEAVGNGCAPIVTDIKSGNKQLVEDGVNGFVVPVGDIDAFVAKIKVLADDREKLLEFRQRAWETGKQYSVERMVEAYENCFLKAIEDTKANPRRPDPGFPLMESCRSKYPLWLRRLKARLVNS